MPAAAAAELRTMTILLPLMTLEITPLADVEVALPRETADVVALLLVSVPAAFTTPNVVRFIVGPPE